MRMSNLEIAARKLAMKRMLRKTKGLEKNLVIEKLWRKRFRREMLMVMGWLYRNEFANRARREKKAKEKAEAEQMRRDNARDLYDEGNPKYREESWSDE